MVGAGASDLFLTVGAPPSIRVDSKISPLPYDTLQSSDVEEMVDDLLTEEQFEEFESVLEFNLAHQLPTGERFRINVMRQQYNTGMVVRWITAKIPSPKELRIPDIYMDFIMGKRGLVLMVGATGSGKSTSMAVMIDHRNKNSNGHIITIEDPIEFLHRHEQCIITQREIGMDTYSYGTALKNALRQSPDVLLIGEIRDRDTLENAILFCETGHLVVATLHANNSDQSIERMVNFFPEEQRHQILATLSKNLNTVVSQRLVEDKNGGRVLAHEIMINEGIISDYIEEGNIKGLKEIIRRNRDRGMITFDQCLIGLLKDGLITAETAIREADNPDNLKLEINRDPDLSSNKALHNFTEFKQGSYFMPVLDDSDDENEYIIAGHVRQPKEKNPEDGF